LNFVSKFDGSLPFTGTHPKAQTHVDTVQTKAPADAIVVKDANLLFNGDFKRSGTDLVISKDDQDLVLSDYFKGEKRAPVASPDGAWLSGKIIEALTGHVQVAQADGSASVAPKIIGHVTKLSGNATVIRNGVSIILNNGDNVHQGDIVQSGSNSTVGITFIDGSVFGLASNARMVLNEMVYDPNGSNNSAFLSLVQGTISFVAGATAKHGDMKVDTPVATMGIRGTAVVVEIDFEVTVPGSAPPARFQVVVEPDGTVGSLVLLDRVTLAPIATVNQAGTVTTVSGQGTVSFLASAQLSPEVMKLITEVFSQKFTDNSNPRSDTHFTDTVIPDSSFPIRFANGDTGTATVRVFNASEGPQGSPPPAPKSGDHIPGQPGISTANKLLAERDALTGSDLSDSVKGPVGYTDINVGDSPTVSTRFDHFNYASATGQDVTAGLTATQRAAIAAVSVPLHVAQDPDLKNNGTATWTFTVADKALDFLADGEKLTLTYVARVDNNFALNNEFSEQTFTITITGTNDRPTIDVDQTDAIGGVVEDSNTGNLTTDGIITFNDVDLTDTHSASIVLKSSHASPGLPGFHDGDALGALTLDPISETAGDGDTTGSVGWTYTLADNNSVLQSLAEGQTITLVYTVTVSDGHGGFVSQDVTVTVTGSNDNPNHAPTIVGELTVATGDVTEDVDVHANAIAADGVITFRDIDLIDTHSADYVKTSSTTNVTLPGFTETMFLGTFALGPVNEDNTDTNDTGSVNWTFTIDDSDPTLQSLAVGQTITQVYTVTLSDHHPGGTVTQEVTVTITGTNDDPTITAATTPASTSGAVVEDGVQTASGTITFQDVDLIDTHLVSQELTGGSASAVLPGFNPATQPLGTLALTLHENNGDTNNVGTVDWTFTINNDLAQQLAYGQVITQTYTVTIDDKHGGTITQPVTVTITGTNDDPTITAATTPASTSGAVVEDGVQTASGTITFQDVDLIDTHLVSQELTGGSASAVLPGFNPGTQALGTLDLVLTENGGDTSNTGTVDWTFTIDNDLAQQLAYGQVITQTYTVTIDDKHGGTITQPVTVTITGTNDDPTITTATATGTVKEDTNLNPAHQVTTSGTIGFNDVDLIDVHAANVALKSSSSSIALPGYPTGSSIGALTLDPVSENPADTNGAGSVGWKFTLDNNNAVLQSLGEGRSITQTYAVTAPDGHGGTAEQDVTITINGTNDGASIVSETNPATHGVMVVNPVSPSIEPAGQNTNLLGLATEDFNHRTAGSGNNYGSGDFYNATLGATFDASSRAGIVHGSTSVSAAPFMGPLPGTADQTNYLSIGAGGTETITFDTAKNTFGLYWGSVDTYNSIKFYDGNTLVASYTGADVAPLLANGNQGSFAANGYVEFVGLHNFNKVMLSSSSNAFEIDNISAGNLPTSHALLTGTVAGTMTVHDPDIGDTLTGVVSANATALLNGSSTLPNGVNVADLIKFSNISFDSVQSDGGTDVLHWNYDPHGANLDFLHAGDTLKITYTAKVSDGHGIYGSQQLTVTLVGTDNDTNVSSFKFVDGTSGNDTFNNVGNGATVVGNGGHDNFVFKLNSGSATITDFDPANDVLTFDSSMFGHEPSNVRAAALDDGHGNTVIPLNATDKITLLHILPNQLNNSDFHFV
jgi:VCBS repeat-containing protein